MMHTVCLGRPLHKVIINSTVSGIEIDQNVLIMHRVRIFESIRTSKDAKHNDENLFITVIRPLLVELVGTFLFITLSLWSGCNRTIDHVQGALCAGCTLMGLLASFGHISGTHLNPCVTWAIFIVGEIQPHIAILYIIMQIIAGIGAAGMLRLFATKENYETCKGGVTLLTEDSSPSNSIQPWQGLIIELFMTFMLITVILLVALDTKSKTGLAPLLIGFVFTGNILAAGSLTGASMNPVRSFGPALVNNRWTKHWVYWTGPLLGATIAAIFYRLIWAHQDRRWPKPEPKRIDEVAAVVRIPD